MGVENIIKNTQEETPSSDSHIGDGPFFDEADPPVIIDLPDSSESDDTLSIEYYDPVDYAAMYRRGQWMPLSRQVYERRLELLMQQRLMAEQRYRQMDLPNYHGYRAASPEPAREPTREPTVRENESIVQSFRREMENCRARMGRKKARRRENARILEILAGNGHYVYDDSNFLSIDCPFKFTKILKNHKLANKILNSAVNEPDEYCVDTDLTKHFQKNKKTVQLTPDGISSPHDAFNNLDPSQKSFITRRNLPMGMLEHLDACVCSFFENDPTGTYISLPLTSFERMMLHCVAQFYNLNSKSFDAEHDDCRMTKITNPVDYFKPPPVCISEYLEDRLWKNVNPDPAPKRRRSKRKR